jgi:hypothetical protein
MVTRCRRSDAMIRIPNLPKTQLNLVFIGRIIGEEKDAPCRQHCHVDWGKSKAFLMENALTNSSSRVLAVFAPE